ncbi:MAG: glutathione S-transferase family protein, partial [Proteobacteria bacterium]|nr:glutathione S-transferase family protein [Pseudomonadota bacterium]
MGLFSRKKKPTEKVRLLGYPGHADTCKSLYLAAEKGVQLDAELIDIKSEQFPDEALRSVSPFGKLPCLVEGEVVTSGIAAVLPYLDVRGGGQPLTPRKAQHLGTQNYWIEVGAQQVQPRIEALVDGRPAEAAKDGLQKIFDGMDAHLQGKECIVGAFSFADVHWVAYLHLLHVAGQNSLIDERPNLKAWFEHMKVRKGSHGIGIEGVAGAARRSR